MRAAFADWRRRAKRQGVLSSSRQHLRTDLFLKRLGLAAEFVELRQQRFEFI